MSRLDEQETLKDYYDPKQRKYYNKGYFAGYRRATLDHLGKVCVNCGSSENLEIDHINGLLKRSRQISDLKDISNLRVLCQKCNNENRVYG